MQLDFSSARTGKIGIVGHAGAGHANSHLGFIQDDSGGLSVVLTILRRLTKLDLTITSVETTVGTRGGFTVKTASGGFGSALARRGVTPFEAELAQRVVGKLAINSQTLSMYAFGRTMGQGAMEVPVALQSAIANASIDSFKKNYPNHFQTGEEGLQGNFGRWLAGIITVDSIDVAIMGLLNATEGGLGPNEDIEGNVNLAGKAAIMNELALDRIPTVIVEGKVCGNPVSPVIDIPTFVTRAFPGDDNTIVSECLVSAARALSYPIVYPRELLARKVGAMRTLTEEMGQHISHLGMKLLVAKTSREKVQIAAEINQYASENLGGITFMSDDIHEVMGGVGAIPGLTGCLSLFIPNKERDQIVYPALTLNDCEHYADIVLKSVSILSSRYDEAMKEFEAQKARGANLCLPEK